MRTTTMFPIFFVLLATPRPVWAAETLIPEKLGYAEARLILIDRGFHPYTMPGVSECSAGPMMCFPEVASCVQKRHWVCNYTWKSGKSIYHVETRAQKKEPPVVDSFYCLLNCHKEQSATETSQPGLTGNP